MKIFRFVAAPGFQANGQFLETTFYCRYRKERSLSSLLSFRWRVVDVHAVALYRPPHRAIKSGMVAPVIELVEVPLSIPIAEISPPFDRRCVWRGFQVNERKDSV